MVTLGPLTTPQKIGMWHFTEEEMETLRETLTCEKLSPDHHGTFPVYCGTKDTFGEHRLGKFVI